MLEQTSVTLSYTQGILQAAERNGICLPSDLCQQATAQGRTPMHIQDEVWEHYCAAADDSLAGLRLGLNLQVGHLLQHSLRFAEVELKYRRHSHD